MELTSESVAESVERARLELLRQGHWDELRESERVTRVEVLRSAMDSAGVSAALDELRARAERSDALAAELSEAREAAQRAAADHDREVVRLADEIAELRAALVMEQAARAAADTHSARIDTVLEQVRGALTRAEELEPEAPAEPAAPVTRGGLLRRLSTH